MIFIPKNRGLLSSVDAFFVPSNILFVRSGSRKELWIESFQKAVGVLADLLIFSPNFAASQD